MSAKKKSATKVKSDRTSSVAPAGTAFSDGLPFGVGDAVLIRTVTMHHLGRVRSIGPDSITLTEASWLADSGRFSEALAKGCEVLKEVERAPKWVCVGRGGIIDVYPWDHDLPTATK